jgi:hypothetical protein
VTGSDGDDGGFTLNFLGGIGNCVGNM